jgi:hypothetical protein
VNPISHAEMADLCAIRIQRTDDAMSKEASIRTLALWNTSRVV